MDDKVMYTKCIRFKGETYFPDDVLVVKIASGDPYELIVGRFANVVCESSCDFLILDTSSNYQSSTRRIGLNWIEDICKIVPDEEVG